MYCYKWLICLEGRLMLERSPYAWGRGLCLAARLKGAMFAKDYVYKIGPLFRKGTYLKEVCLERG